MEMFSIRPFRRWFPTVVLFKALVYSTGMLEVVFILTCVPVVTNIASLQFHDRSAQVAPTYLHVDVVTRKSRRCKICGYGF